MCLGSSYWLMAEHRGRLPVPAAPREGAPQSPGEKEMAAMPPRKPRHQGLWTRGFVSNGCAQVILDHYPHYHLQTSLEVQVSWGAGGMSL